MALYEIKHSYGCHCIDLSDTKSIIKSDGTEFTVVVLNIQSINDDFDSLYQVKTNLSLMGLHLCHPYCITCS